MLYQESTPSCTSTTAFIGGQSLAKRDGGGGVGEIAVELVNRLGGVGLERHADKSVG